MKLREKLLEVLRKKLKNDNMFMSETRLVVHNIPKALSDKKLKDLIYDHVKKAKKSTENIQSARLGKIKVIIMRNREGNNKSRGYAFVYTDTHEAALLILRTLNNNPEVFLPEKRPIVEFCCENKKALDVQEKRRQRSDDKKKAGEQFSGNNPKRAKSQEITKNAKSNVKMEEGKLFKHQGMPAQRRRKGEKLTVPRLKKKARHNENKNSDKKQEVQGTVESVESPQKAKTKKSPKVKEVKTANRKAGKMAKEKKEEQDFSKLVQKYSAKLG